MIAGRSRRANNLNRSQQRETHIYGVGRTGFVPSRALMDSSLVIERQEEIERATNRVDRGERRWNMPSSLCRLRCHELEVCCKPVKLS